MTKYFFLTGAINEATAIAYTNNHAAIGHELMEDVKSLIELPFTFNLKSAVLKSGTTYVSDDTSSLKHLWQDFQPNNLAWPHVSEKMKSVIDSELTGKENVTWKKTKVTLANESRNYFVLLFEHKLDVLCEAKTKYVKGTSHIIKPVFDSNKIGKLSVFHKPQEYGWEISSALYVRESLKRKFIQEHLTGIGFEEISVSF